jgi:hypothetical protein
MIFPADASSKRSIRLELYSNVYARSHLPQPLPHTDEAFPMIRWQVKSIFTIYGANAFFSRKPLEIGWFSVLRCNPFRKIV